MCNYKSELSIYFQIINGDYFYQMIGGVFSEIRRNSDWDSFQSRLIYFSLYNTTFCIGT